MKTRQQIKLELEPESLVEIIRKKYPGCDHPKDIVRDVLKWVLNE